MVCDGGGFGALTERARSGHDQVAPGRWSLKNPTTHTPPPPATLSSVASDPAICRTPLAVDHYINGNLRNPPLMVPISMLVISRLEYECRM
jgi:hypothetical protein